MNRWLRARCISFAALLALALLVTGCAGTPAQRAAAPVNETEMVALGFKPLVAATTAQSEWVKGCPPGRIRAMERNGKKFYIMPDAANNRVFVGGPVQYEAYQVDNPKQPVGLSQAEQRAYLAARDQAMRKANAYDRSDPFYGVGWGDFLWY